MKHSCGTRAHDKGIILGTRPVGEDGLWAGLEAARRGEGTWLESRFKVYYCPACDKPFWRRVR